MITSKQVLIKNNPMNIRAILLYYKRKIRYAEKIHKNTNLK